METGRTVFAQLIDFLPRYDFQQCVQRYRGNYKIKTFSCWDQFLCMAFAQLTYRESLRDIEACLRSAQHKLYHIYDGLQQDFKTAWGGGLMVDISVKIVSGVERSVIPDTILTDMFIF